MSKAFLDALVALDVACGVPSQEHLIRGQAHHHKAFLEPTAELFFAERLGDCGIFYLSCDGGYSRLLWSEDRNEVGLSNTSIEPTISRFKAARAEQEAVNRLVRQALFIYGGKHEHVME